MVERQRGAIVNLGSVSAFTGQEHEGQSQWLYNMTKAAAVQLSISLGTRYAAEGHPRERALPRRRPNAARSGAVSA